MFVMLVSQRRPFFLYEHTESVLIDFFGRSALAQKYAN